MCDLAVPAVLDRYAAAFRACVDRFQDSWHLCVLADTRCRAEHWEAEQRRQALFHDSNPELSANVPGVHGTVLSENLPKIVISGRRNWKTSMFHKASAPSSHAGDGRKRSRSPKGTTKNNEDKMEETTHCAAVTAGIAPHLLENKSVSSSTATGGCADDCPSKRAHVCEFVWKRIAQWSVLVTWGGRLPKVRVRGSTRASGEFVRCVPAKVPSDHWTQVWSQ